MPRCLAFAVARRSATSSAEGIKVNPRWYIAGTTCRRCGAAGNIHLAPPPPRLSCPSPPPGDDLQHRAQSDIAGTQQIVLGKKGQEIVRSPKDFEKIKIGMPKGASVTMAIQAMARDTGVDFAKIQFVNLSPPDAVTALAKGDIDAMAAWAPWCSRRQAGRRKVYFAGNGHDPRQGGPGQWRPVNAAWWRAARCEGESQHAEGRHGACPSERIDHSDREGRGSWRAK